MNTIEHVDLDQLKVGPWKATHILRPDLLVLSSSIRDYGIISPLVVQKKSGYVIDGNERLLLMQASKQNEKIPVMYMDVDDLEAQMIHLRLNRGRGMLLAKPTSKIIRNLVLSKKYVKSDFENLLKMKDDEYNLMVNGSLLKVRKIAEHSYSRAWVPVEANAKITEMPIAIETPPNDDR